jgi:prophage antirepressor-like protein
MPALELSFQNTQFDIIDRNGCTWLKSSQIATALGYSDQSSINRIYARNKDEFSESMSASVKLTDPNGDMQDTRIFSLRGCHLLAMLSKTKIAKDFRKWVLDLIDRQLESSSSISESEAQQFKKSMENHCKHNGKKYSELYRMVYDYFGITSYKNIPNGKLSEACQVCGMDLIPLSRPKITENKTPISLPAPTVDKLDCASARNTLYQLKQLHKDQESITRLEHLERCYIKAWTEMDESIFRLELALGMLRRWRTTL